MLFHSPETLQFIILTLTNFSSVSDTVPDTSSILEIFTMVAEFIMPCGRISNGITQSVGKQVVYMILTGVLKSKRATKEKQYSP